VLRLTRVAIENYRSIKQLEFKPKMLCALVGANNAGKSNILTALDLLLGSRYPTENSLTEDDFYERRADLPPFVSATFEYDDEAGFTQEMRIEFGPDPTQENALKLRCWGEGRTGGYIPAVVRERFSLIRLDVYRGSRQHQPTNRWTLLGRLLLEINSQLQQDEERMEQFRQTMEVLRDEVLASVPSFVELVTVLREESARQLQRTVEDVSVEFSLYDPWNFYRTLQLVVEECGMTFRAEQVGMGLQSSLTIALLRAYARIARQDRAVIAIEEPELFLHPLAQRQFYRLMRQLAHPEDGSPPLQILYTTHSGELVDLEYFDELCLVKREQREDGWTTTAYQAATDDIVDELRADGIEEATELSLRGRLRAAFDRGRSDGAFAAKVIVVEGAAEELALPVYAESLGIELDAENIAVVAAGGKGNIPLLYRIFRKLGVVTYAVFDADGHKDDPNEELNAHIFTLLGEPLGPLPPTTVTDRCAVWEADFERMLRSEIADYEDLERDAGRELGGPGKGVCARYCAMRLADRGEVPQSVRELLERVRALEGPVPEVGEAPERPQVDWDDIPF
jgi:putative ATP-dependent endonuclease of OLD family